ncbi:hypothetical protein E4T47_08025 [Aureobasidium subglaciale]|nr:hypothetical protein E4T47_08025 [Aureobasidium subglaciale]
MAASRWRPESQRERRQRNGDRANSPPNLYGHNPRNGLLPNGRPQTQPLRPLGGLAQWPRPVVATVSNMVPQARPHDDLGAAADPPRTNSKRAREEDIDDMDVLLTARLELKDGRNIRRNENQVKKLKQHKDIAKVTLEDYSTEPAKEIATWAVRRMYYRENVLPGMVIRALHSCSNDDLKIPYPSNEVRIFPDGPVFAKWRPMIPGLGLKKLKSKSQEARLKELIPVRCHDKASWKNYDLAKYNGSPLNLLRSPGKGSRLADGCFADISRTIAISRTDNFEEGYGSLTKGSYARLLHAFRHREQEAMRAAMGNKLLRDHEYDVAAPVLGRMKNLMPFWAWMQLGPDDLDDDDHYYVKPDDMDPDDLFDVGPDNDPPGITHGTAAPPGDSTAAPAAVITTVPASTIPPTGPKVSVTSTTSSLNPSAHKFVKPF